MNQQTTNGFPNAASILALVGGILMILGGLLFLAVSVYIIPHLPVSFFTSSSTTTLSPSTIQGFAAFVVGGLGAFGLVSGIIVLGSGIMLQVSPSYRRTWGVLILVFSVLSFLGTGGFVVGAVLGILGGIKALTWKQAQQAVTQVG